MLLMSVYDTINVDICWSLFLSMLLSMFVWLPICLNGLLTVRLFLVFDLHLWGDLQPWRGVLKDEYGYREVWNTVVVKWNTFCQSQKANVKFKWSTGDQKSWTNLWLYLHSYKSDAYSCTRPQILGAIWGSLKGMIAWWSFILTGSGPVLFLMWPGMIARLKDWRVNFSAPGFNLIYMKHNFRQL